MTTLTAETLRCATVLPVPAPTDSSAERVDRAMRTGRIKAASDGSGA